MPNNGTLTLNGLNIYASTGHGGQTSPGVTNYISAMQIGKLESDEDPNFNLNLILADGTENSLSACGGNSPIQRGGAGLAKPNHLGADGSDADDAILSANKLIISGNGTLTCTGDGNLGAGIGGEAKYENDDKDNGAFIHRNTSYIQIDSGTINAYADITEADIDDYDVILRKSGAGIGGAEAGSASHITINGGTINASCSVNNSALGAGIGGGGILIGENDTRTKLVSVSGGLTDLTITGGIINAHSADKYVGRGAGIGGGGLEGEVNQYVGDLFNVGAVSNIDISGGEVKAYSSYGSIGSDDNESGSIGRGAGIGTGSFASFSTGRDIIAAKLQNVSISGGNIVAIASNGVGCGAGIGTGDAEFFEMDNWKIESGAVDNLTISGGTIIAASANKARAYGAGIGSGHCFPGNPIRDREKQVCKAGDVTNVKLLGGTITAASKLNPGNLTYEKNGKTLAMGGAYGFGAGIGSSITNTYGYGDSDEWLSGDKGNCNNNVINGDKVVLNVTGGKKFEGYSSGDDQPVNSLNNLKAEPHYDYTLPALMGFTEQKGIVFERENTDSTTYVGTMYSNAATLPAGTKVIGNLTIPADATLTVEGRSTVLKDCTLNVCGILADADNITCLENGKITTEIKGIVDGVEQAFPVQIFKTVDGIQKYVDVAAAPNKEGYTYLGWYSKPRIGGVKLESANDVDVNAHTFYARYSNNNPIVPPTDIDSEDPYTEQEEQDIVEDLTVVQNGEAPAEELIGDAKEFYDTFVGPYKDGSLKREDIPGWAQEIMKQAGIFTDDKEPDDRPDTPSNPEQNQDEGNGGNIVPENEASSVVPATGDTTFLAMLLDWLSL